MPSERQPPDAVHEPAVFVGATPRLSWSPRDGQRAVEVRVTANGISVWTSMVETDLPEVIYAGPPLASRTTYSWQVRTLGPLAEWSEWSPPRRFETALLQTNDWAARWITKPAPSSTRQVRAMPALGTEWVGKGEVLRQPFHAFGPVIGASLDLRFRDRASARGLVRLITHDGRVVAEGRLSDPGSPPDRFSSMIVPANPAPAGDYAVELTVEAGEIGWRHGVFEGFSGTDASPIPLTLVHERNGAAGLGPLALGVETFPAANPEFRHVFVLDSEPTRARLYGVGLGYATFFINGKRVGEAVLEPAQSVYERRVVYTTYDVTEHVERGQNEIVVRTGRGFWSARGVNVWGWNLASWASEPIVLAQLESQDSSGARTDVSSGADWMARASNNQQDLMFTGITHRPLGPRDNWSAALVRTDVSGSLTPRTAPQVLQGPLVLPTRTSGSSPAVVFDFGRILTGSVRITVESRAASALQIKYGEVCDEAGAVVCDNVLASGQAQVDRLELDGPVDEYIWQPEFCYKGFRYVEVRCDGPVELRDIAAVPYVTDVRQVGTFDCNDTLFTWIAEATSRTLLNNMHGVLTDTPTYEKNGWTADAHLIAESAIRAFDLRDLLTKWLDDHVDSADSSGVVPQIIPTPGWGRRLDPAWSGSLILLPWNLYWEYGDIGVINRYLDAMNQYLDTTLAVAADAAWIWPLHSWGDWVVPGEGPAPEGPAPTATMAVFELAERLADMNALVGSAERSRTYREAANNLARAYHERYFDPGAGVYGSAGVGYRQTMNAMPLSLGAVPDEHLTTVVQGLVRDIEHRTDGHLDCGATGVKHLLPALSRHDRLDVALTVVGQQTEPGWGSWRSSGDGTLWEAWTDARSHNHYFLGSVTAWLHENVAGMKQTAAGWRAFTVDVPDDHRLTRGESRHNSVRGAAAVHWLRDSRDWRIDVDVPAGASAVVRVPGHGERTLGHGRHTLRLPTSHQRGR